MLHPDDSLCILENMKTSHANRLSRSIFLLTNIPFENMTKKEVIKIVEENWFKLKGVGEKTFSSFYNAVEASRLTTP